MQSSSLQELEQIPGVGKTIARDMQNIGIHSIDDLKGRQAQQLYDRLCEFKAAPACPEHCLSCLSRAQSRGALSKGRRVEWVEGRYASNTDHDPGLPSEALAKAGAFKMGELEG